jgi:hypothetical protein
MNHRETQKKYPIPSKIIELKDRSMRRLKSAESPDLRDHAHRKSTKFNINVTDSEASFAEEQTIYAEHSGTFD